MKHGELTKIKIIQAGLEVWRDTPTDVTARSIARRVGLTHSAILYHFKNTDNLKNSIALHAVVNKESKVILHLIAINHPAIKHLNETERAKYMRLACET